jgi:hypothetical protein
LPMNEIPKPGPGTASSFAKRLGVIVRIWPKRHRAHFRVSHLNLLPQNFFAVENSSTLTPTRLGIYLI